MKYVYRIVHGLLAAAVFPAFIFLQLFYAELSASVVGEVGLAYEMNVKRIIDIFAGKDYLSDFINADTVKTMTWPEGLNIVKGRLIVFAVFLVLALLIALFIVIWSCISDKKPVYLIASAAGLVCVIGLMITFNSIAGEFEAGAINLVSLVSDSWWVQLLGGMLNVDRLTIGGFANGILFLYIGMLVWTGVYYLTDLGADSGNKAVKSEAARKIK